MRDNEEKMQSGIAHRHMDIAADVSHHIRSGWSRKVHARTWTTHTRIVALFLWDEPRYNYDPHDFRISGIYIETTRLLVSRITKPWRTKRNITLRSLWMASQIRT